MLSLEKKSVLVVGLGSSGVAAARLLVSKGAVVTALDQQDNADLRAKAESLASLGVASKLGTSELPPGAKFDLVVVSPGVPENYPPLATLRESGVQIIGELELGYQASSCLHLAITGTNGKTTTTELISQLLTDCQRRTIAAGNIGLPLCDLAEQTRELDFTTLEVSSFQLDTTVYFRPSVGVLLNITPDHLDRYPSMDDYALSKARLFKNQQAFDWAVVQKEAWDYLQRLGVKVRAKVITFSAERKDADVILDRGLILSRLPEWEGLLFDMAHAHLKGPHNAENIMAALVVGRILRLPLGTMQETIRRFRPAPHRCELVAEINGVAFINDSKATNVDALVRAVQSITPAAEGRPNVWVIAGGKDKGFDYHEAGPILAQRCKGAFLIGETREKIRAAWGLFTPCRTMDSLLEAVHEAARLAVPGDVVLLSPACSSFDQFRNYQHRGEVYRHAVKLWADSTNQTPEPERSSAQLQATSI
jgi:UDP-N-acetylmuramoylalanine--D-glutamate ligase